MKPLGPGHERAFKSQSAMEYLMTYGWAILIIAVVLAALFELGVFNPMTFAPKASPGSCQVIRPEGAGTTNFISLEGECNGEIPQYVSYSTSTSDQLVVNKEFFQNKSFTILAWVYWPSSVNLASLPYDAGYAWSGAANTNQGFGIFSRSDHWYLNFYGDDLECSDGPIDGEWYLFGASWNNTTKNQTIWVNGAANCSRTSSGYLVTNESLYLLSGANTWDGATYVGGYAANIQLYSEALSANQVMALYKEGIGGAPMDLQSLESWWPLNGNGNDYSGNNNNGAGTTQYTSNWYSGYSAP